METTGGAGQPTASSLTSHRARVSTHQTLLIAIIVAGLALRIWAMARANWMLDGDEATFGLMAKHILAGERPTFLYGQPYMGSFQAYLAAPLFALFGMSREAFKAVTLVEFVAFAASIYLLARRVAGSRVALLATLFAALPPVYVLASTARMWGPLLDTMTLGNLMLLLAIDEAYSDAPPRRPWLRFLAIGLMAGFGFWLHGQILIYVATAAIVLFLGNKRVVLQPRLLAAAAGFVVGAAPVINFALTHQYTTFHYMLGVGAQRGGHAYSAIAKFFLRVNVPRVLGISLPWAPSPLWLKLPIALILAGLIAAFVAQRWRGILGWLRLSLRDGKPEDALILFAGILSLAFVFSSFGDLALQFKDFDATGRYAIPLVSVVPIILAIEITRVERFSRPAAGLIAVALLSFVLLGYARSAPAEVWQSPYWRHLPASNQPLITTLDGMGVDAVWVNHWAGTPLMFDTQERIAAADYYDLAVGHGIDRLPADTGRVSAADLPAFVFVTSEPTVPLEGWLEQHGIPYQKVALEHYVVIRPERHVDPADVVDLLGVDAR